MNPLRIYIPALLLILLLIEGGCTNEKPSTPYFPGEYPGEAQSTFFKNKFVLSNRALKAKWEVVNNSIVLKEVTNKYDQQTVSMEDIRLFAIELDGERKLSNKDFQLLSGPEIRNIEKTDSLPTQALRYSGKEITASMIGEEGNIVIEWKAILRDGSNYIRQNIKIKPVDKPVKISKVMLFDGKLDGATYAGSVLGSPIEYKNFIFGFEHPIAKSKALLAMNIGSITKKLIDVSKIIDGPGEYIISVEHGGGPVGFNIHTVSLSENDNTVSFDKHPLNGENGSSLYRLKLEKYNSEAKYHVHAEIFNIANATGTFHIYRKTDSLLNFYVNRTDELLQGKFISEWSVIVAAPPNQKRRAFLYYLERERARPYKQFLHYNCWWDITSDGIPSFTSEQLIERMHAWNQKFIKPYDVDLKSFVFDDGWDDLDHVWYFDPIKFPDGFAPQATLCKEYNSGIGVWMSPFGGYGENKRKRIESAKKEGLETNDKGLSLAGPNYNNRFLYRALDMLDNYKVNYFKFDGFGGSNPQYLPDMEAGARLISELRKHNPDVFINITVGSWPSPFWLKYADCTWRGSGDLHNAGEGSFTQMYITYRDGTLHNNIVNRAPYYPLNSIMVVGIAYANLGLPSLYINDKLDDFKDMVRSFFAAGSSLQELYISHNKMKDSFWPVLAESAKWAKANENILKDTHWIGGSPINLEVYGFASWRPGKGIMMLRNPGSEKKTYDLNLSRDLELSKNDRTEYQLKSPWKEDLEMPSVKISRDDNAMIELEPFELKIFEILPVK